MVVRMMDWDIDRTVPKSMTRRGTSWAVCILSLLSHHGEAVKSTKWISKRPVPRPMTIAAAPKSVMVFIGGSNPPVSVGEFSFGEYVWDNNLQVYFPSNDKEISFGKRGC